MAVLSTVAATATASALAYPAPFGITLQATTRGYTTAFAWFAALFLAAALATHLLMRPPGPITRRSVAGVLLAVGSVHFFVAHLGVQAAWPAPYSWPHNYISDLDAVTCSTFAGRPACSPAHEWMNTAFVLQGAALVVAMLLSRGAAGLGRTASVLLILNGLGFVVIGLVPEDVDLTIHSLGAYPIFLISGITVLLEARRRDADPLPPGLRRTAVALGVAQTLGAALLILTMQRPDLGLGIGIPERLAVFPLQVFAALLGVHWSHTQAHQIDHHVVLPRRSS